MTRYIALEIRHIRTSHLVHRVDFEHPRSERSAERVERGANINLNHERFYTVLVPEEGAQE